jgi:hypothetical protein
LKIPHPGFEIVEFWIKLSSFNSSLLCEIEATNGFLSSSSIRWVPFSASYSRNILVSLLEIESGTVPENSHLPIYSLCAWGSQ